MKPVLLASAALLFLADASAVSAQSSGSWTGPYFGGRLGFSSNTDDSDETVVFDTDLDGEFNDSVLTTGGNNAFSPGFCGGTAVSSQQANCSDRGGTEWAVHAGYDLQLGGSFLVGVVAEYGQTKIRDGVTAFSTTPAFYTLERRLDDTAGIRARAGVTLGDTLVYGTGGAAYGKIRNRFTTNNGANTFTDSGDGGGAWGYRVGGGVEQRFAPGFSLGVQYLYTSLEDDDPFTVRAQGPVPVSNPFILDNPAGTDFRRTDDKFNWHNLSVTASFRF